MENEKIINTDEGRMRNKEEIIRLVANAFPGKMSEVSMAMQLVRRGAFRNIGMLSSYCDMVNEHRKEKK